MVVERLTQTYRIRPDSSSLQWALHYNHDRHMKCKFLPLYAIPLNLRRGWPATHVEDVSGQMAHGICSESPLTEEGRET